MIDRDERPLREELDLEAWEVDDAGDDFADRVLDEIVPSATRDEPGRALVSLSEGGRPVAPRSRRIAFVAAAAAAAGIVGLWWASESRVAPDDAASSNPVAAFDGVAVTAEDGDATWRWLSTSDEAATAEQTAGRVRWDAQRGVALTVQTPAGRVTTTRAAFSLEVLDMSTFSKKNLAFGTAFTGSVAAVLYLTAGDVHVSNDQGALAVASPKGAVMSDTEAPRALDDDERPILESGVVPGKPKPKIDWAAARVGIQAALDSRFAAERAAADARDRAFERSDEGDAPVEFGNLTKEYIREAVQEDVVPLVRECYNDLLYREPATNGRMVLEFTIMGDETVGGIVDEMTFGPESEIQDLDFRECVSETMKSTVFEPPEGGGQVRVTYPFVFATDPDPDPESATPHLPAQGAPSGDATAPVPDAPADDN